MFWQLRNRPHDAKIKNNKIEELFEPTIVGTYIKR